MGESLISTADRTLGSLQSNPLAFGCWRFTDPDVGSAQSLLETALESGMNLVDTADVYGLDFGGTGFGTNEEILGNVLAQAPGLRDRIVLATKGGVTPPVPYDSSPAWLRRACEDSLRRLQVDVIDLYQIHRPDMYAHPHDVAETLAALRHEGKIREVGVSNYTPSQYDALASYLPFPLVSSQPELSPAEVSPLRDGTLDRCMRDGVTPLAYSPLAGGRLVTGEGVRPELLATLDRLAEREGVERTTLAVAWVLAHPSRPVVLLGTQNADRLRALAGSVHVRLDRNDVYDVIEASEGVPLP